METVFWSRFVSLCKESGTTPTGVCKALGLSTGSPPGWKRGRIPSYSIISKIAAYFGVEPEYFVAETEKAPDSEEPRAISRQEIKLALFGADADRISDEKLNEVLRYAEIIKYM